MQMRPIKKHLPGPAVRFILTAGVWLLCVSALYAQRRDLLPVLQGGKWGLIDTTGKQYLSPRYDGLEILSDSLVRFARGLRYGLASLNGTEIIPADYHLIRLADNVVYAGVLYAGEDSTQRMRLGFYNFAGRNLVPPFAHAFRSTGSGYMLYNLGGEVHGENVTGGRWGVCDLFGKTVRAPEYLEIKPMIPAELKAYQVTTDSGTGAMDAQFRWLIRPRWRSVASFRKQFWLCQDTAGFWIVQSGDSILTRQPYESLSFIPEAGVFLARRGSSLGCIAPDGREIIPLQYASVQAFGGDWFGVRNEAGYDVLIRPGLSADSGIAYESVIQAAPSWCITGTPNGLGVLDTQMRYVIPPKYAEIIHVGGDTFRIGIPASGTLKWVNAQGKPLCQLDAESFRHLQEPLTLVKKSGKMGLLSPRGEWVVPMAYDTLLAFSGVVKAMTRGAADRFYYYTAQGNPSQVRRLMIVKESIAVGSGPVNFGSNARNVGWFTNSAGRWGLRVNGRVMLQPTYESVEPVDGTELSIVMKREDNKTLYGIVNHVRGVLILKPSLSRVFREEWITAPVARAFVAETKRYCAISRTGEIFTFAKCIWIGPMRSGLTLLNIGGEMIGEKTRSIYTVDSVLEPSTQRVTSYTTIRGGKWTYMDSTGKMVVPPTWDYATDFEDGLARVVLARKWGVINTAMESQVEPQWDYLQWLRTDGRTLVVAYRDQRKWTFMDSLGKYLQPAQWEDAGDYAEGVARVKLEKKWGFVDAGGSFVLPAQWLEAGDFSGGYARVREKTGWTYVDHSGAPVTALRFVRAGDFHHGLARVSYQGLWGYINTSGEWVVKPQFGDAGDFTDGVARVSQKGNWGLLDTTGAWVLPPRYYRIHPFEGELARVQQGGKWGAVNRKGEFLIRPVYEELGSFATGLARARQGFSWGYLRPDGTWLLPPRYGNALDFTNGYGSVYQAGWMLVDSAGNVLEPTRREFVAPPSDGYCRVTDRGLYGFITLEGKDHIACRFTQARDFHEGIAAVYIRNQGWGFVNQAGNLVVPCGFDQVTDFRNGVARVQKGGSWGILNTAGTWIVPLHYSALGVFKGGCMRAQVTRTAGLLDTRGNVLLPAEYLSLKSEGSFIQVKTDRGTGYVNRVGDYIWMP